MRYCIRPGNTPSRELGVGGGLGRDSPCLHGNVSGDRIGIHGACCRKRLDQPLEDIISNVVGKIEKSPAVMKSEDSQLVTQSVWEAY